MDTTKESRTKRTDDVFRKIASVPSFISTLLIVALFLRMEMINKRTEMNELRIWAVESRLKMTNKADENVKNKPKTFIGRHKTIQFDPDSFEVWHELVRLLQLDSLRDRIWNKKIC